MIEYGELVAPEDVGLTSISEAFPQGSDVVESDGALWSYIKEGKIDNIPVKKGDTGLPVSHGQVYEAFFLVCVPKCAMFWLSPDDTEQLDKYNELIGGVANGGIAIMEEARQYDQEKHAFATLVRYNEMHYELHPRFNYLREELQ